MLWIAKTTQSSFKKMSRVLEPLMINSHLKFDKNCSREKEARRNWEKPKVVLVLIYTRTWKVSCRNRGHCRPCITPQPKRYSKHLKNFNSNNNLKRPELPLKTLKGQSFEEAQEMLMAIITTLYSWIKLAPLRLASKVKLTTSSSCSKIT